MKIVVLDGYRLNPGDLSRARLMDCAVENLRAFLRGESANVVNGQR